MAQVPAFWSALDTRRRIVAGVATLAMFLAIMLLARGMAVPTMGLLYAGLDPVASGGVLQALEQRGVRHEIRGDAIWVPEGERDQLRMQLAGEGLPAGGTGGYELLDQLSGFGTTAQMFDAAWIRAREGELARTISASPFVRTARVHLAVTSQQGFRRDRRSTAAVSLVTQAGVVTAAQAQAIRHLVASSIPGMTPEEVTVTDAVGGLVGQSLSSPQGVGDERAAEMRQAVERLLSARVGPGNVMVEVNVDVVTERETLTERRFDPQGRVAISSDSETRTSSASGAPPGVTVASTLPEGDAAGNARSNSQDNSQRERMNYEVSGSERQLLRVPGDIRRLSVAVLVDGIRGADGTWQERSVAELSDLRELVASAVGLDEARGDTLTIKSMAFEVLPDGTPPVIAGLLERLDVMSLIQIGVLALVLLALGLFVVRPVLTRSAHLPPVLPAMPPVASLPVLEPVGRVEVLEGGVPDELPEDPVARLRRLIRERQAESVEILRGWIDERGESH